jgi:hypothetical protein
MFTKWIRIHLLVNTILERSEVANLFLKSLFLPIISSKVVLI